MKSSVQFSANTYFDNISKLFKKLYDDEELTDVTIYCKDGSIKAHKLILSTSSPYFHKIFTENTKDHPILFFHGVSFQTLHDLVELIYKGNVEVLPEDLNSLYNLAGEFQLTGITGVLEGNVKNIDEGENLGRDTRFRGQKRVAVDYNEQNDSVESLEPPILEKCIPESQEQLSFVEEMSIASNNSPAKSDEPPKLSAWARKQRKFKCELCPSSFKRSSHLTRHQLVHTGERPFACEQCDKAFSRHDKLKHHIRKAHEFDLDPDLCLEINHDIDDTEINNDYCNSPSPPPFIISHVRTEAFDDYPTDNPPKRPRGRPRKYPIAEKPLIKRGRGRPRLTPMIPFPLPGGENYDITNLPFGDLEYLTMPLREPVIIEPLVEIKTEKEEEEEEETTKPLEIRREEQLEILEINKNTTNVENLMLLENKIATIGECTISVANSH